MSESNLGMFSQNVDDYGDSVLKTKKKKSLSLDTPEEGGSGNLKTAAQLADMVQKGGEGSGGGFSGMLKGGLSGAMTGNPYLAAAGAGIGLVSGLVQSAANKRKLKREQQKRSMEIEADKNKMIANAEAARTRQIIAAKQALSQQVSSVLNKPTRSIF